MCPGDASMRLNIGHLVVQCSPVSVQLHAFYQPSRDLQSISLVGWNALHNGSKETEKSTSQVKLHTNTFSFSVLSHLCEPTHIL